MRVTEEWLRLRLAKSDNLEHQTDVPQPCDRPKAAQRKAPKKLKLTMYEPAEWQVLPSIMEALQHHPAVAKAWRVNTAAGQLLRADGSHSQYMKFGFEGCPDINGYMKTGQALYVEAKRPSGYVRPAQAAFIADAKRCGCKAFIARSVDDVWRELGVASRHAPVAKKETT